MTNELQMGLHTPTVTKDSTPVTTAKGKLVRWDDDGKRPVVILVHGMNDSPNSWNNALEQIWKKLKTTFTSSEDKGSEKAKKVKFALPDVSDAFFPYLFGYDTRMSIDSNGERFAACVKRKAETDERFRDPILIAHSMGGLVSRAYVTHGGPLRKLVTLSTPHLGSPLAAIPGVLRKLTSMGGDLAHWLSGVEMSSWVEAAWKELLNFEDEHDLTRWMHGGSETVSGYVCDGCGDLAMDSSFIRRLSQHPRDIEYRDRYVFCGAYLSHEQLAQKDTGNDDKALYLVMSLMVQALRRDPKAFAQDAGEAVVEYLKSHTKEAMLHAGVSVLEGVPNDTMVPLFSSWLMPDKIVRDPAGSCYGKRFKNRFFIAGNHNAIKDPGHKNAQKLWAWIAQTLNDEAPSGVVDFNVQDWDWHGVFMDSSWAHLFATSNANWMERESKSIADRSLMEIALPGTHDSGTSQISPFSQFAKFDGNLDLFEMTKDMRQYVLDALRGPTHQIQSTLKNVPDIPGISDIKHKMIDLLGTVDRLKPGSWKTMASDLEELSRKTDKLARLVDSIPEHIPGPVSIPIPGAGEFKNGLLESLGAIERIRNEIIQRIKGFITQWSRTTDKEIRKQLDDGIRYFDMRIECDDNTPDATFVVHALRSYQFGMRMDDLKETVAFVTKHPKEVVVIDFNHLYHFTPEFLDRFLTRVKEALSTRDGKSLLIPRKDTKFLRMSEIWKTTGRVVVLCAPPAGSSEQVHRFWEGHPEIWKSNAKDDGGDPRCGPRDGTNARGSDIHSHFISTADASRLLNAEDGLPKDAKLTGEARNEAPESWWKFTVTQAMLSPSEIPDMLGPMAEGYSLQTMANDRGAMNDQLLTATRSADYGNPLARHANLIMTNWYRRDIIDTIIDINRSRAGVEPDNTDDPISLIP